MDKENYKDQNDSVRCYINKHILQKISSTICSYIIKKKHLFYHISCCNDRNKSCYPIHCYKKSSYFHSLFHMASEKHNTRQTPVIKLLLLLQNSTKKTPKHYNKQAIKTTFEISILKTFYYKQKHQREHHKQTSTKQYTTQKSS